MVRQIIPFLLGISLCGCSHLDIKGIFMPTGLGIYWVTSNAFTIVQNTLIKRSKKLNGKA